MLTLTHCSNAGTVLDCPHRPDMVAPVLRPIGWRPHTGGVWRLSGTRGRPADPRRIELTARALRLHGFTVANASPPATSARRHGRARPHAIAPKGPNR